MVFHNLQILGRLKSRPSALPTNFTRGRGGPGDTVTVTHRPRGSERSAGSLHRGPSLRPGRETEAASWPLPETSKMGPPTLGGGRHRGSLGAWTSARRPFLGAPKPGAPARGR